MTGGSAEAAGVKPNEEDEARAVRMNVLNLVLMDAHFGNLMHWGERYFKSAVKKLSLRSSAFPVCRLSRQNSAGSA